MDKQTPEIILETLIKLNVGDLYNMCKSSKKINDICKKNSNYIFKNLLKKDYNIDPKNYLEIYKEISTNYIAMLKIDDVDYVEPCGVFSSVNKATEYIMAYFNPETTVFYPDVYITDTFDNDIELKVNIDPTKIIKQYFIYGMKQDNERTRDFSATFVIVKC
jgi:hypothetical protein